MPDRRSGDQPDTPDPAHAVARELLHILPFGARAEALVRCPRLAERVDGGLGDTICGTRTAAGVVAAIEAFTDPVHLPDRHPDPLAPELVRHMLHVLLATRDLGWPGTDAPLSVRRVAAADLFFDATQTVLADHDWKGPHGVEFALLTALGERVCRTGPRRAPARRDDDHGRHVGGEMLGRLGRVHRPRGL